MIPSPGASPRVVIRDTRKRDTLIAVIAGLILLIFVGYGVIHMSRPVQGNKLQGEVIQKIFIAQQERQVRFSGRKIEGVREIAGEYVLKVRVPSGNRIYDVPVEEYVYNSKNVGDTLIFLRPPSEQH